MVRPEAFEPDAIEARVPVGKTLPEVGPAS